MAMEERGKRKYYYRKERVGGKVTSIYVGSGEYARLAFQMDKIERKQKAREAAALNRQLAKAAAIDGEINSLCELTGKLVDAFLLASGFHQHKREWRLKRK